MEDVKGSFEQLHMHQQGRVFPYLCNEDNDLLVLDNSNSIRDTSLTITNIHVHGGVG